MRTFGSLIGSYAINGSMFDVYVAIFFGLLGFLMDKYDFSSPALILGLILGSTAERGLMLSRVMSRGDMVGYYFGRPICLILMALIVMSIAWPIISSRFAKKKQENKEV